MVRATVSIKISQKANSRKRKKWKMPSLATESKTHQHQSWYVHVVDVSVLDVESLPLLSVATTVTVAVSESRKKRKPRAEIAAWQRTARTKRARVLLLVDGTVAARCARVEAFGVFAGRRRLERDLEAVAHQVVVRFDVSRRARTPQRNKKKSKKKERKHCFWVRSGVSVQHFDFVFSARSDRSHTARRPR